MAVGWRAWGQAEEQCRDPWLYKMCTQLVPEDTQKAAVENEDNAVLMVSEDHRHLDMKR